MKTLYLARHAQAGYESEDYSDLKRKLTDKGLKSAKKIGHYLKKHLTKNKPLDQITASAALRTATTAQLIAEELDYDLTKIQLEFSLYETDVRQLLHFLTTQEDSLNSLLVVNHNPTVTNLVSYLTGESFLSMKPATLVELQLEIPSWQMTTAGCAKLIKWESF